ncbi:MAG: class I SAM-dependent methyltransferase [Proteobacteria bacterium]|nr:class I SAM-dependent methyltransferase [Pseudomonadota bacterium]
MKPPALPTFRRYWELFWRKGRMSIARTLQYEVLSRYSVTGKLLDVGGGERTSYRYLLDCDTYDSVNIDPDAEPTWVVGVGERLPCPDQEYDIALSMNTFEHIFDVHFVLGEMLRVLKPGGKFVTSVPFLHPVHGHPDDFFRPTSSWWFHSLQKIGFEDISVTPVVWGPFSTGLVCSGTPGPGKGLRRHIALLLDLLYARLRSDGQTQSEILRNAMDRCALGFFVTAAKK